MSGSLPERGSIVGLDHVRPAASAEPELVDRENAHGGAASAPRMFGGEKFRHVRLHRHSMLNEPRHSNLRAVSISSPATMLLLWVIPARRKTHVCLALGLAPPTRLPGLLHGGRPRSSMMEAHVERRLLKLQAQHVAVKLLLVDEFGYVPSHRPARRFSSK